MYALRDRPSWIAWAVFGIFLLGVLAAFQLLLQSPVRLLVDQDGIYDSSWEIGTLRWAEVDRIFIRDSSGEELVCLVATDQSALHSRMHPVTRKCSAVLRTAGFGDLFVNATRLGIRADDILALAPSRAATSR